MSFGTGSFGSAPFGAPGVDITDLIETVTASDALLVSVIDMVRAQVYARDIITSVHLTSILESLSVSDGIDSTLVYGIVERLFTADALLTHLSTVAPLFDTAVLRDRVNELAQFTVSDTADAVESATATRAALAAVVDAAIAVSYAHTQWRSSVNLLDAAVAAASIASVQTLEITDEAQAQAALLNTVKYFVGVVESLSAADAVAGSARLTVLVDDAAETTDTLVSGTTFYATIEESLTASMTLLIEGQPYTAVVLNTYNKAASEYAPYDFNSLAFFNGQTYGANALGVFKLVGDDDAGTDIAAYARTALSRIAGGKLAQVDSAYVGYSSDGTVQLKTIVTEPSGAKTSRVYQLNTQNADASRSGRIKLGRGVKSAYWAFEISNVLGADFTIDVVEMHVMALSRRI